jgi:hypothetical protein
MFRVKINLSAIRHDHSEPKAEVIDRMGDWAEDMANTQPRLTREELCRTFGDKFGGSAGKGYKTVA